MNFNFEDDLAHELYNGFDSFGFKLPYRSKLSEHLLDYLTISGDGEAGKSSLIDRIVRETFVPEKPPTDGIVIENYTFPSAAGHNIILHIWDFGGQEMQHPVHKFFFTEGCLYVLVISCRNEGDPEYWLQQIEILGGSAPVLVVFNKHDENPNELVDRRYLKEKYPNIIDFCNTSCKDEYGISDFKMVLKKHACQLKTVREHLPDNWLGIKKGIEQLISGSQHYIDYDTYTRVCNRNFVDTEKTQEILLKYLTTIGAVTWFGDIFLNFFNVLSPAWITQAVYRIITSPKTRALSGRITIDDFTELLTPLKDGEYFYDRSHFGYILNVMKKFELCYSADDKILLIPSAFSANGEVDYADFRGQDIRCYILQFKEYLPIALIHRFIAKNLTEVFNNTYWYSGIIMKDRMTGKLVLVYLNKSEKRIYIRIKSDSPLGIWEHLRREFSAITARYARIPYDEFISLDDKDENVVAYEELISHVQTERSFYYHWGLQQEFNVGYLLGFFQTKEETIQKITNGEIRLNQEEVNADNRVSGRVLQIINNVNPIINNQINIEINISEVNKIGSDLKGDINYLLSELGQSNQELKSALTKLLHFSDDSKVAQTSSSIKEKGWGWKLKSLIEILSKSGEQIKHISEGAGVLKNIFRNIGEICSRVDLGEVEKFIKGITRH